MHLLLPAAGTYVRAYTTCVAGLSSLYSQGKANAAVVRLMRCVVSNARARPYQWPAARREMDGSIDSNGHVRRTVLVCPIACNVRVRSRPRHAPGVHWPRSAINPRQPAATFHATVDRGQKICPKALLGKAKVAARIPPAGEKMRRACLCVALLLGALAATASVRPHRGGSGRQGSIWVMGVRAARRSAGPPARRPRASPAAGLISTVAGLGRRRAHRASGAGAGARVGATGAGAATRGWAQLLSHPSGLGLQQRA